LINFEFKDVGAAVVVEMESNFGGKYSPQGSGIYNRVADQKVGTCCDGAVTVTGDMVSARLLRNGRLVIVAHVGMSPQTIYKDMNVIFFNSLIIVNTISQLFTLRGISWILPTVSFKFVCPQTCLRFHLAS
jgi:hypothetical protein